MFDDIVAQYQENVVAPYVEYRELSRDAVAGRSRDLRAALAAASSLFHFREHLPAAQQPTRAAAEQACSSYGLLGDVVNAAKHATLHQKTPHGPPLVEIAENIFEQLSTVEYEDDEGSYTQTYKAVIAKLTNGTEANLLEALTDVLNYWEKHLHACGLLTEAREFKCETSIPYRARAECRDLAFEVVRGQRFQQRMQFFKFDRVAGKATPVDLTQYADIQFTIRRPRYVVDIAGRNKSTGEVHTKSVTLTADESETWSN